MRKFMLILAMLAAATQVTADKIYTWVDDDGQVVFGDRPPQNTAAEEVKIRGGKSVPVEVDIEALPGTWTVIDDTGQVSTWIISDQNEIEMETINGSNRTLVDGSFTIEDQILNVTTDLIQTLINNKMERNDAPTLLVYKFTEFSETRFKVYNNGGILTANKN